MRVLWVSLAILVADQITKVWVKTSMFYGESIPVIGRLFRLTFTENPGMAFGLTLGSKLFLTLFSLVATVLIGWYLWIVRKGHWGYRLSLACILGGATGNIIDRVFYGEIFGYAPLFYGKVVDFIHVDLWRGFVPLPWRDEPAFIALFPIGNIADLAIMGGIFAILIFQGTFQRYEKAQRQAEEDGAWRATDAPLDSRAPAEPVEVKPEQNA
jgi:signal peptidase II